MRCIALALLVAVLLAACSSNSSVRQFETRPGVSDQAAPYPVVLNDESGLVTGIESVALSPIGYYGQPAIRADSTDPNAFFISWFGGPAHDAALSFKPFQDGYLLRLELHSGTGFPGGGIAIGVPRDIRIVTSRPIPLDSIQVGGSANT